MAGRFLIAFRVMTYRFRPSSSKNFPITFMKTGSVILLILLLLASPLVLTLPWKDWMQYGDILRSLFAGLGNCRP